MTDCQKNISPVGILDIEACLRSPVSAMLWPYLASHLSARWQYQINQVTSSLDKTIHHCPLTWRRFSFLCKNFKERVLVNSGIYSSRVPCAQCTHRLSCLWRFENKTVRPGKAKGGFGAQLWAGLFAVSCTGGVPWASSFHVSKT